MYLSNNITINSLLNAPPLFLLGDATYVLLFGEATELCCGDLFNKTLNSFSLDSFKGDGDCMVLPAVPVTAFTGVLDKGDFSCSSGKLLVASIFLVFLGVVSWRGLPDTSEECLFTPETPFANEKIHLAKIQFDTLKSILKSCFETICITFCYTRNQT